MADVPTAAGAERYVISCCLNEPTVLADISSRVKADDFYYLIYKYAYQIALSLYEDGLVPEPVTIYNRMEALGVATPDHLKELELLAKASYDVTNLDQYIEEIRGASTRRRLIEACTTSIKELSSATKMDATEAVGLVEDRITTVGSTIATMSDVYRVGSDSIVVLQERANAPVEVPGLRTGLINLDQDLQGLQDGRLYAVAARPKVGKSIALMNIALNCAVNLKVPVLIIDTEMTNRQVEDRMLSNLSGVKEQSVVNGTFANSQESKKALFSAIKTLEEAEIYHVYLHDFTPESVVSVARKYRLQKNVGLVIFDYIKMPDSSDASLKEHQLIGQITSVLKNKIAGPLEIPVVTACQLGRGAIDATYSSDELIADSDRIGRFADCILWLRPKTGEEQEKYGSSKTHGNLVMNIHLNRYGPSNDKYYDLWMDYPIMRMKEVKVRYS